MRALSDLTKSFFQRLILILQPLYLHFKYCYLLVLIIGNKLEVLNSVIISNSILMMNYFPIVKTATKTFSHHQTMLSNIIMVIGHWVEEILRIYPYKHVTIGFSSATFPRLIPTAGIFPFISASNTTLMDCLPVNADPAFLTTVDASVPDVFMTSAFADFLAFFNISYFTHRYIILYQNKVRKELTIRIS